MLLALFLVMAGVAGASPPPAQSLGSHEAVLSAGAWSRAGSLLATGDEQGGIRIWDTSKGRLKLRLHHSAPDGTSPSGRQVRALAFSPDGQWLASGLGNASVRVWNLSNGTPLSQHDMHSGSVTGLAFSPDGARLASTAREVLLFDLPRPGTPLPLEPRSGSSDFLGGVAFSPDGKVLVAGGLGSRPAHAWEVGSGRILWVSEPGGGHEAPVAFSPDGRWVAVGGGAQVRLLEAATGRVVRKLPTRAPIGAVDFSPDGAWLVALSVRTKPADLHVWTVATGQEHRRVEFAESVGRDVRVGAGGAVAVATSRFAEVLAWNASEAAALTFAGVGMELEVKKEGLFASGILASGPAHRAGLPPGTRILSIDGRRATDFTAHQAADLIRGPVGSAVVLEVLRPGASAAETVRLVRAQVERGVAILRPVASPAPATGPPKAPGLSREAAALVEPLRAALDQRDPVPAFQALRARGGQGRVVELLAELLGHPDREVRRASALALDELWPGSGKAAVPSQVLAALQAEGCADFAAHRLPGDPRSLGAVLAGSLGRMGQFDSLRELLGSKSDCHAAWAAWGLRNAPYGAVFARDHLVAALDHPSPWVRGEAIRALRSVPSDELHARLRKMLGDPDAGVRIHAMAMTRRVSEELGTAARLEEVLRECRARGWSAGEGARLAIIAIQGLEDVGTPAQVEILREAAQVPLLAPHAQRAIESMPREFKPTISQQGQPTCRGLGVQPARSLAAASASMRRSSSRVRPVALAISVSVRRTPSGMSP